MRRFLVGTALLAVLLLVGVWAGNRMERVHMPCAVDLQWAQTQASQENWVEATALTQRARDTWHQNWHFTATLANHEPMDEIDALFEELKAAVPSAQRIGSVAEYRGGKRIFLRVYTVK